MIKNILNLRNTKVLKKEEQKHINGGFSSICPEIRECMYDHECEHCNATCGVIINGTHVQICTF